jgi:heptosyltransferase-2
MIWHLSFIRTVAREVEGGPIYLLTKSKAQAKTWLYNEPSIGVIDYLDQQPLWLTGWRLRTYGFRSAWVLHQSFSHAVIPVLARIPERIGPGYGHQRFLLTNRPLSPEALAQRHIKQMQALFVQQGLTVRVDDQQIRLDPHAQADVDRRYSHLKGPWIAFGIGASEACRCWPLTSFIRLAQYIHHHKPVTFLICGAASERLVIQQVVTALQQMDMTAVAIDGLTLPHVFALLARASLFVGNDSGLLNASACLGVPSVGLFGASLPLSYSPYLYAVTPERIYLKDPAGMQALSPEQVFDYLLQRQLLASVTTIEERAIEQTKP